MPSKNKNKTVIAVCIQELKEDGSTMDLGAIEGDDLKFLHQAIITDSINQSVAVKDTDIRLYHVDQEDRKRLVDIVTGYSKKKRDGKEVKEFEKRFSRHKLPLERWGLRIEKIFKECFEAGYTNVLLIGSRTPTITTERFAAALKMLKESDAVFGPTVDGRYYIIGMSGSYQIALSEFSWVSPKIYSEVAEAFTAKELSWSELEIWYTVEEPDDIDTLARDINQYRFEGDLDTARETEIVLDRILTKLEQ